MFTILFTLGCQRSRIVTSATFSDADLKQSIIAGFKNEKFKALLNYQKTKFKHFRLITTNGLVDSVNINGIAMYINPSLAAMDNKPSLFYTFSADITKPAANQVVVTFRNVVDVNSFLTKNGIDLYYEYINHSWKLIKDETFTED